MKEGWQLKRLADVAIDFGRGKSKHRPRNDPRLYGGQYPFIQTGDIRNSDHLIETYSQTYNDFGLAQSKLWPKGTLCITIAANIAETGILTFDACFPDSVIGVVVDKKKTNNKFLEYLLQSFKLHLQAQGKGSAQANINMGTFEDQFFPFPPLSEQQRIVSILDQTFDAIATAKANTQQNLANAHAIFESYLNDVFTRKGDGWKERRLGDEVNLLAGFAFKSSQYTKSDEDIKLLRGDNIIQGDLRWDDVKRWSKENTQEFNRYMLVAGDVVLAMDRPWVKSGLKHAMISEDDLPCLLVQRVARLRSEKTLNNRFLMFLLKSSSFIKHILGSQTGIGVPHISGQQIEDFPFDKPSVKEQQAIVEKLNALRTETQRLAGVYERKLAALEELKKSILQQAFEGSL